MHYYINKYNNMNCNYDCDESPSLNSNDCLMKDVTVLNCSSVDVLSIFVSFSSWFNSIKFEYIFWKHCHKMFRLLVFLLHSKKKWNSSSKTLQIAHSLWSFGILRFLPIYIKGLCSLCLNFVKIVSHFYLDVINNIPFHYHFVFRIYTSVFYCFHLSLLFI
jgi:hypothetical protein